MRLTGIWPPMTEYGEESGRLFYENRFRPVGEIKRRPPFPPRSHALALRTGLRAAPWKVYSSLTYKSSDTRQPWFLAKIAEFLYCEFFTTFSALRLPCFQSLQGDSAVH